MRSFILAEYFHSRMFKKHSLFKKLSKSAADVATRTTRSTVVAAVAVVAVVVVVVFPNLLPESLYAVRLSICRWQ